MLHPLDYRERIALGEQLRRLGDKDVHHLVLHDNAAALDLLCAAVAADHAGQPRRDNVTTDDVHGGLRLLVGERDRLDQAEVLFIEAALDRGESLTDLAKVYDISRQALTKRYYALGGVRTPLTGTASGVAPHGTVVRYWMALTEAEINDQNAIEVQLHYSGNTFRPDPPPSLTGGRDAVYVGELPRPGTTVSGRVYPTGNSAERINVWVHAEAQSAEEG